MDCAYSGCPLMSFVIFCFMFSTSLTNISQSLMMLHSLSLWPKKTDFEVNLQYFILQLIFEITRGKDYRGDVGLDDITIEDGACQVSHKCFFENKTNCGFENGNTWKDECNVVLLWARADVFLSWRKIIPSVKALGRKFGYRFNFWNSGQLSSVENVTIKLYFRATDKESTSYSGYSECLQVQMWHWNELIQSRVA